MSTESIVIAALIADVLHNHSEQSNVIIYFILVLCCWLIFRLDMLKTLNQACNSDQYI